MGSDMMVALGRATVDGQTLFGHNTSRPAGHGQTLCRAVGREFAPGEKVQTQYLELPQVRQTNTVLGSRPESWWGYSHGVNEHGVAMGCTVVRNKLRGPAPGLTGGDLVRLVLERTRSARQAVDLLADLVERQGQSAPPDAVPEDGDNGFLIVDPLEAFAVEAAGPHWVSQEIREVRAASNVCIIRQDWDHISRGLAATAIQQGWWPDDGRKLDFAGALSVDPVGQGSGLRRWGRATLLLEQQNGHIDVAFLRWVLSDHYDGTHFEVDPVGLSPGPVPLCQHAGIARGQVTAASLVIQLSADPSHLPILWVAFGPPCLHVYFPVFLDGDLPPAFALALEQRRGDGFWSRLEHLEALFQNEPKAWDAVRERLGRLQARFDQDAEEFAVEGATLRTRGELAELRRRTGLFMQQSLEQFERILEEGEESKRKPHLTLKNSLIFDTKR
jgi:dipeptidase